MTVVTDREKLIEEAAKAIKEADSGWSGLDSDDPAYDSAAEDARWLRDLAEAALAVFEKAHTPTDDEREALAIVKGAKDAYLEAYPGDDHTERFAALDRLAAGFRRSVPVVPEPSAETEAEMHARGVTSWDCPDCGNDPEDCYCGTEPQGEPSDAAVDAAAQAMFEPDGPGGEYTWAEMVVEDPSRADIWREDARKVLRAASAVAERPEIPGRIWLTHTDGTSKRDDEIRVEAAAVRATEKTAEEHAADLLDDLDTEQGGE